MEYVNFDAKDENASDNEELVFSDNEGENFIDDSNQEGNQSPSFCRFMNQTRDPAEAVNDDDVSHLDRRDLQPDMFYCINRKHVEFDEFDNYQNCAEKFIKSLCSFQDYLKDSFFNAILYGLLFHRTEDNKVCKDKAEEILGKQFFDKFKEKKEMLQLDHSFENFFKKCHFANDFLEMKGLFLRVYER